MIRTIATLANKVADGASRCLLLGLMAVAAGCASTDSGRSPDFESARAQGLRVAVLPFRVTAPQEGRIISALGAVGSLLALEGLGDDSPPGDQAAVILRRAFAASLAGGPFEVSELWATDTRLSHLGLTADQTQDRSLAPSLAQSLGVDAIVYGDVERWNRSYYVVEARATVALRVELVDGRVGHTLFWERHEESSGAGLSGGPTGQISAVTEPLKGLSGDALSHLARSVAGFCATALNDTDPLTGPLEPPLVGPSFPSISFASVIREHEGTFQAGDTIRVVVVGSPDQDARFDLGRYRTSIPMVEIDRVDDPRGARSTYLGTYVVTEGERAVDLPVFVTLRDPSQPARLDRQRVQTTRVTIEPTGA
ncbi:MAG: DUF799 family lipoprotein [Planctomycetes bacterium]|nr:DUF799 family lipoprotein [Planctomycetota bacterium]